MRLVKGVAVGSRDERVSLLVLGSPGQGCVGHRGRDVGGADEGPGVGIGGSVLCCCGAALSGTADCLGKFVLWSGAIVMVVGVLCTALCGTVDDWVGLLAARLL